MEIGDPIAVDELAQFVTEAREQGKRPAFLSNASFGPEMVRGCNDPNDPIYAGGVGLGLIVLITK